MKRWLIYCYCYHHHHNHKGKTQKVKKKNCITVPKTLAMKAQRGQEIKIHTFWNPLVDGGSFMV
jgi:hypothetical protein